MSLHVEPSKSTVEDDEDNIYIFDQFNIINEYIPCPEQNVNSSLEEIMREMKTKINNLDKFQGPPYFAETFGGIREEAYQKFNEIIRHFSGSKRNQYKRLFYKDIDIQFEEYLNKEFPIKAKYKAELQKGKSSSFYPVSPDISNMNEAELTVHLLNLEVQDLVYEWYVLIDKAVDVLMRCQFYEVKDQVSFRELYTSISANWGRRREATNWKDWFKGGFLKNLFGTRNREEKPVNYIDLKEFLSLMSAICCGTVVNGYFQNSEHHMTEEILIKMKAFMLILTQGLHAIIRSINELIEDFLATQNIEEKQKYQKDLEDIIDQLINTEGRLTVFDQGFLKEYFKEDLSKTSAGTFFGEDSHIEDSPKKPSSKLSRG